MPTLPPQETPALRTFHLEEGVLPSQLASRQWQSKLPSFSTSRLPKLHLSRSLALGATLLLLPIGVVIAVQPSPPKLSAQQAEKTQEWLAQQKSANAMIADGSATENPQELPTASNTLADGSSSGTEADTQLTTGEASKTFNYYLTLGKGFLNKAIDHSRHSASQPGGQTQDDKNMIMGYLEKALENTNKAIDLDSRQGAAFLLRARIYKTAATIKPELNEKSEQDLQIARALGIDDTALNGSEQPLDYVPTEQANNLANNQPIIADPESGSNASVSGQATDNAQKGQAVLQPGSSEVYVPFPGLTANMQLSVKTATGQANPDGLTFSIHSRKEGKGFTIRSSSEATQNVTLDWQATDLVQ